MQDFHGIWSLGRVAEFDNWPIGPGLSAAFRTTRPQNHPGRLLHSFHSITFPAGFLEN